MTKEFLPPSTLVHPPWREMAESLLRGKDPELYQVLLESGSLQEHLNDKEESARRTYESLVARMQDHPNGISWVFQAVQEVIVHDIRDPTT